jgi:hypothetical protein
VSSRRAETYNNGSADVCRNALTVLKQAIRERDAVNAVVSDLVQQARDAGATWDEIAELLEVTRQAASKRYGREIDSRS